MVALDTHNVSINTTGGRLTVSETVPVSPKKAWAILAAHHQIKDWWGNYVAIEAIPGGNFEQLWTDKDGVLVRATGKVTDVAAPYVLGFTWTESKWDYETRVMIRLSELGKETLVEVTHDGWPENKTEQMRNDIARLYYGWRSFLQKMKSYAATHQ